MEKRRATNTIVMVLMVLGMVIGNASCSTFSDCYKGCFLICVISPGTTILGCGSKCLKDCFWPNYPASINSLHGDNNSQLNHFFCNYGCASALCTSFSSKTDAGEEKVEKCVNSCSVRCTKNYRS